MSHNDPWGEATDPPTEPIPTHSESDSVPDYVKKAAAVGASIVMLLIFLIVVVFLVQVIVHLWTM